MQKKKPVNINRPKLPSEQKPSDLLAHEELAHEDKDPIYPLDSGKDKREKGPAKKKRKAG